MLRGYGVPVPSTSSPDPTGSSHPRRPSNLRRSGNPATRAAAGAPAPISPQRSVVSERSRATLLRLSRLPTLVIPGVVLVLMLVGLGAPLLLALPALGVIALFVAWLAYLSWPVLDTRGRLTRGLMLAIVIGSAVARTQGWL